METTEQKLIREALGELNCSNKDTFVRQAKEKITAIACKQSAVNSLLTEIDQLKKSLKEMKLIEIDAGAVL